MCVKCMFIFFSYEHLIKKEDNLSLEFSYVENQLNKPNNFFMNDFMDTGKLILVFPKY